MEPRTAAGRALLADPDDIPHGLLEVRILAIEAEATRDALLAARAAVEDIRPVWLSGPDDKSVSLGQVLAAIDALREGER